MEATLLGKEDSIKLSKTSTDKYSWEIKITIPDITDDKAKDLVISKLKQIDDNLKKEFMNKDLLECD